MVLQFGLRIQSLELLETFGSAFDRFIRSLRNVLALFEHIEFNHSLVIGDFNAGRDGKGHHRSVRARRFSKSSLSTRGCEKCCANRNDKERFSSHDGSSFLLFYKNRGVITRVR